MNGRRLFREYAQSKGKGTKEFVNISSMPYDLDTLTTLSNAGKVEITDVNYKEMVHWIIKTKKL